MWQVYANLFFYSFCYYVAKEGVTQQSEDVKVPAVVDTINNSVVPLTMLGSLLLAFFQDKLGSKFSMSISQLSGFLIYAVALLKLVKSDIKEIDPVSDAAKLIPASAFILLKVLPMLQHTMQIGKAAVVCLRPWDRPMAALSRGCWALVAYSLGVWAGPGIQKLLNLDVRASLLFAAVVAGVAWLMNSFTFPDRQRAPAAVNGTRVESPNTYPGIFFSNPLVFIYATVLGMMWIAQGKIMGDYDAPAQIEAFSKDLGVKVDYLMSPVAALVVFPVLSMLPTSKNPARVAGAALFLAVAIFNPFAQEAIPANVKAAGFNWFAKFSITRVLYIAPGIYYLTAVMPGTTAQSGALGGFFSGLGMKAAPIVFETLAPVLKPLLPPVVANLFTVDQILAYAIYVAAIVLSLAARTTSGSVKSAADATSLRAKKVAKKMQ